MWEFKNAEDLDSRDRAFIDQLMSYENSSVIERLRQDKGYDANQAEEMWKAWKQFAATSFFMKGRKVTSKYIDDVWHAFLLHSRQYSDFCQNYWGGHFFHHEPAADEASPEYYRATREYARKVFGELNEDLWPKESTAGARCLSGGDCRSACTTEA